jgi:hypothetical protein
MRPLARGVLVFVALAGGVIRAHAAEPSADRIQAAAEEFDTARRAYLAGDYHQAAIHFENAYHDAPRPEPLRSAIRARRAAKDDARAATLASLGAARYADDPATLALAKEVLAALEPSLLGVKVTCDPECAVAVDGREVSIEDARETKLFLPPGKHALEVSWGGGRSAHAPVEGSAGTTTEVTLQAPPLPPPPPPPITPPPVLPSTPAPPPHVKPLGPALFVVGAGLTVVGVGATILSGVVTLNDPGTAAVKRDCVGQGTSCPEYQRGLDGELRTNVLLGTTLGVGVLTAAVGLFFTQWSGSHASVTSAITSRIAPYASAGPRGFDLGFSVPL